MELKLHLSAFLVLYVLSSISLVYAEFCDEYGHSCNEPYKCCGATCCIPSEIEHHYRNQLRWSVWNMWYFWFVVLFVLMSCFGGCSYYRRHQLLLARHQGILADGTRPYPECQFSSSFPVSLFSGYSNQSGHQRATIAMTTALPASQPEIPTQMPRPSFPSPPAYSEVVSHPEVYPPHKDNELPPYPGPDTRVAYNGGAVIQLPPYSPSASTVAANQEQHCNQNQLSTSNNAVLSHCQANNSSGGPAEVVPSSGRTQYDCKTQTVSGIGD